jgi:4-hydroxyphenylpyruvate 3-dimethylallyltransferase
MATFCPNQFLADIRATTNDLGAPYSEETTRKVLEIYATNFKEGAVLWRYTDRKGDPLNYRFYERRPVDLAGMAEKAGLLSLDSTLTKLVRIWCSLYDGPGTPEQSCDFDSEAGLVKIWVYLKGIRPLDDVLNAPRVLNSSDSTRLPFILWGWTRFGTSLSIRRTR